MKCLSIQGNVLGLLRLTAITAVSFCVIGGISEHVAAAGTDFGVTPITRLTVSPGSTVSGSITVRNLNGGNDIHVSVNTVDFKAKNQTGTPELLMNNSDPTPWSLKPYLNVEKTFDLPSGGIENLPISVTVPKNIAGGSYYSAVQFAATNTAAANANVGLNASATGLVFVRVTGSAQDNEVLTKFGPFVPVSDFSSGTYQTIFGSSKPKYLSYALTNKGNVVGQPNGNIRITSLFGKQFAYLASANPNQNSILLGQTRRIDVCLNPADNPNPNTGSAGGNYLTKCQAPKLMPGRYTAHLTLSYGIQPNMRTIAATSSFWYLPPWFIIATAAVLLIVVGLVWWTIRRLKNHGKPTYGVYR